MTFPEKQSAFAGPFGRTIPLSVSTRVTPMDGVPGPVENEIPISQLPLAGVVDGSEMVAVVQNGITCRATTGSFILPGPSGPPGPAGAPGPAGPAGPSGPPGIISDAPLDGNYYSRRNAAWTISPGGLVDAPSDSTLYARKSATWSHVTHLDITDWTASLAPYALAVNVPTLASTTPLMNGVGAPGVGTTVSRADHVHPSDTTKYDTSNPANYQTAAQVSASIAAAAYVLPTATTSVLGGVKIDGTSITISGGVISSTGGIADAPSDGTAYARKSATWQHLTHNDITDWSTTLLPYALTANVLPLAGGTMAGPIISVAGDTINGAVGTDRSMFGATAGSKRWAWILGTSDAESGFNYGSNAALKSLSDTGAALDTVFTVERATGNITHNNLWIRDQFAQVTLDKKGVGESATVSGSLNGLVFWRAVFGDGTPMTGANAGQNYYLLYGDDSGGGQHTVMSASRATGVVTFPLAIVNGPSDRRLKEKIAPLADSLAKVLELQGVSFNLIGKAERQIGLIAQDVEPVVPEVVQHFDHEGEDRLALDYPKLVAVLIEAVKELTARVAVLEAKT